MLLRPTCGVGVPALTSTTSRPTGGSRLPRRSRVPTPTDDRRDLLTVIAYMRAAPGTREELRAALEALVEPTSQEKGYVNYDLHQGEEDPDSFFFHDNWESGEDLAAHLTASHLQAF